MSHLLSGSAAIDVLGAVAPSRPQAAAASALPMSLSFSAMSVAPASAAAEAASAAGTFLAEVDVIVERGIQAVGVGLHVVTRQHVALPRLHAEIRAPRSCQAGEHGQQGR